jgi:hypothetical protein
LIRIEKPRLSVPASLIVDDPAPCINPFYYYRLQVDREGAERHEPRIPLDFLEQFADLCGAHGLRGKFLDPDAGRDADPAEVVQQPRPPA